MSLISPLEYVSNISTGGHVIVLFLQAMLYLYKLRFKGISLRPLGHVQTGNIFMDGDVCRLGGYENTLLGYWTSIFGNIARNGMLAAIDVIMFGECG